jgi:hypothetical protein
MKKPAKKAPAKNTAAKKSATKTQRRRTTAQRYDAQLCGMAHGCGGGGACRKVTNHHGSHYCQQCGTSF